MRKRGFSTLLNTLFARYLVLPFYPPPAERDKSHSIICRGRLYYHMNEEGLRIVKEKEGDGKLKMELFGCEGSRAPRALVMSGS